MCSLAEGDKTRDTYTPATSDGRFCPGVPQEVLVAIRRKIMGRCRKRHLDEAFDPYVETDPIMWSTETDDGNALALLEGFGWDNERVRQELTLAISEEGHDFVRALLEDLISRARQDWEGKASDRSLQEGNLQCRH